MHEPLYSRQPFLARASCFIRNGNDNSQQSHDCPSLLLVIGFNPIFSRSLGQSRYSCKLCRCQKAAISTAAHTQQNAKDKKNNLGLFGGANHDRTTGTSGITSTNIPSPVLKGCRWPHTLIQNMVKDIPLGARPSFSSLLTLLLFRARYTASAFTSTKKQAFT